MREVVEYDIHLISEGPGGWESDPWVYRVRVQAGGPLSGSSSCTLVDAPEQQWGTFDFKDVPREGERDELPFEEGELLEDEFESEDSTSAPSEAPTEESASPEGDAEVDGPTSTPSPGPMDEPGSPGEDKSPEPDESPTEAEPSESGAEEDAEEPGDDEGSPESGGVPESSAATAPRTKMNRQIIALRK